MHLSARRPDGSKFVAEHLQRNAHSHYPLIDVELGIRTIRNYNTRCTRTSRSNPSGIIQCRSLRAIYHRADARCAPLKWKRRAKNRRADERTLRFRSRRRWHILLPHKMEIVCCRRHMAPRLRRHCSADDESTRLICESIFTSAARDESENAVRCE